MSNDIQIEKSIKERPPIQKWGVVGIVIFFVFGYFLAAPCLCPEGAVKGLYTTIFYLVILARLLYGLFRRNLKLIDYFLLVGFFIGFCVFVEFL